jgi:trehalose 6-phosphate phosphatase
LDSPTSADRLSRLDVDVPTVSDDAGDSPTTDDRRADDPPSDGPTEADDATADLPPPLGDHLYAVVEALVDADGLLVALDFDGTLAGIEDRPDDATIPEATREAVAALASESNVAVAVISGRELADVRERVGLDDHGIAYAGNHGLEVHADEYAVHPAAREAEATIAGIADSLADRLAGIEGAIVENKGVTSTVHTRLVADEDVPTVENAVESLVAERDDVRLTTGKDVLELRPAVEWDKGEALRDLADDFVPDDEPWLVVYLGDDTTDEAAFAVLSEDAPAGTTVGGGLPIKVGDDPDTDAAFRVADPEAVREMLEWLGTYGVTFLDADPHERPGESA